MSLNSDAEIIKVPSGYLSVVGSALRALQYNRWQAYQ